MGLRDKSKGQERREQPRLKILSLDHATGPVTQRQKAATIISFTEAVCLSTISVALGEGKSADECSCSLSVQTREHTAFITLRDRGEREGGMLQVANDKAQIRIYSTFLQKVLLACISTLETTLRLFM